MRGKERGKMRGGREREGGRGEKRGKSATKKMYVYNYCSSMIVENPKPSIDMVKNLTTNKTDASRSKYIHTILISFYSPEMHLPS